MSVIASIEGLDNVLSAGYRLGAFDGNQCHGIAAPTFVGEAPLFFISISGTDDGQPIRFLLHDENGEVIELIGKVDFKSDALTGSLKQPVTLYTESVRKAVMAYPNPFSTGIDIEVYNPTQEVVEVAIVNMLGQEIFQSKLDNADAEVVKMTWDGINDSGMPVSPGVYRLMVKKGEETTSMLIMKNE